MRRPPVLYSPDELAWIEANRTMARRELHAAFVVKFRRGDVSQQQLTALCKRRGWLTGRTGRFAKGQPPSNKGKPMPFHPNSAKTRFKKGQTPANLKPLFHERIGKDGYVEMKVPVRNPYTGHKTRYMHKHRYLWEEENGPLPRGHALKCLDGDRSNTDPANWKAVPRGMLPRLAGRWNQPYDDAEPELKPVLMATARLAHKAREIRKAERE